MGIQIFNLLKSLTQYIGCDSQVYGLGRNDHYELGLNDTTDRSVPTLIPLNDHIVQIACGEFTSVALTRE